MATSEPAPPVESAEGVAGRVLLISSDGHAIANMEDYRPYLPSRLREDFDAFCVVYREHGGRNSDPGQLAGLADPGVVEKRTRETVEPGCLEGTSDPGARVREQGRQGCAGVVPRRQDDGRLRLPAGRRAQAARAGALRLTSH
jgi:hypothetical protein